MEGVAITEIVVPRISTYKVVPDADGSLLSYNAICINGRSSTISHDWSAMYLQFRSEHALGTVPYRWERGFSHAKLVEATFFNLKVVIIDGPLFHDGNVDGKKKADMIKELLNLDPSKPLMEALGDLEKAALIRETEDEWELILSHSYFPDLAVEERDVAVFERHPKMPVTRRWRLGEPASKWHLLAADDSIFELASSIIPDLGMEWLPPNVSVSAPDKIK
mmetsp:Transcript_15926/g.34602  ORF Transcript_15926/g.34602 Transcript_15926/m.34602 type:complete len:221 (-) Transcript_15926:21-683(-)|eukprot:CAMPEP_0178631580 /NCGR_PEP_ID=MMETSP0698-20121128/11085_1 /TAXON_ID=265572 /ORGANISM="Extubocellulus spinifer, Strain CCMP396" /LENGTH=220 /DNA_ID=CAMNT_0020271015 /DNA_START=149 /DNA_END=811 /DNA_ORIENTATION=-